MAPRPAQRFDRSDMETEMPGCPVAEVVGEGIADRGEGQLVPGDVRLFEQARLQRLGAGAHLRVQQSAAEQQVHLVDVRKVIERKQGGK